MAKKAEIEHLNRIGDVLKKKGVSQYRLAKEADISYSLVNGYCQNKTQPGLKQLKLISEKLGVPGKDLITF